MKIYPVIMAGGSGTRFWPLSRNDNPKQFLHITSQKHSMLQLARNLITDLAPAEDTYIVTGAKFAEKIKTNLPDIPKQNILLEPCARDTAPCIGLAAATIQQRDPNGIMLVMPCDHWIEPKEKYTLAVKTAIEIAKLNENLVTFGITPKYPATCYGYIEKSNDGIIKNNLPVFTVKQFKEKPNEETAKSFIASKNYFWNSGIFIWQTKSILNRIKELMPDLYAGLEKMKNENFKNIEMIYPQLPKISIDFGIMEKSKNIQVIGVNYDWDDIGNWESLLNHIPTDALNNLKQGEVIAVDTTQSTLINDDPNTLLATVGLENILVVKSGNAVLIAPRNKGQDIKKLIAEIIANNKNKYL